MINLSIQTGNETQNVSFDDEIVRIGVDFEATLGKG